MEDTKTTPAKAKAFLTGFALKVGESNAVFMIGKPDLDVGETVQLTTGTAEVTSVTKGLWANVKMFANDSVDYAKFPPPEAQSLALDSLLAAKPEFDASEEQVFVVHLIRKT